MAVLGLMVLARSAAAADYTVGTTADPSGACGAGACSLRQLIAKVQATPFPPDTIRVPAGVYTLDPALGELVVTTNLTIAGAGANATTIAMPVPADRSTTGARVFHVDVPMGGATPTVAIRAMKITGGTAQPGNNHFGGNLLNEGTLTLSDVWVTDGSAYSGGGVANQNGTLTVERSLISGNSALFGGGDSGAIQNFGTPASPGPPATPDLPGHLVVSDSTVTGNSARLVGGIYSWNDNTNTLVVTNSTIAGNATTDGPALPARDGAGGLGVDNGTEVVSNSIVAGNVHTTGGVTTPRNCGPLASGGITSLGHNIDSGSDCAFSGPTDLNNTDPRLGPLRDNGGPTQTLALGAGSPALDRVPPSGAGCPPTDQRGVPRPQGTACDIGAFELGVAPASTAPPTIAGRAVRGRTLTEAHGAWSFGPTAFAHQWLRCDAAGGLCAPIPGATAQTHVLDGPDVGATLRVQETGSNAFGSSAPAVSAPTAAVAQRRIPALRVRGSYFFFKGGRTRIRRLSVSRLLARSTLAVSCRSPRGTARANRCAFKKKTIRVRRAGRTVQLAKRFKQRLLARNTKIVIRARTAGYLGRAIRLTTRRLKVPRKRSLCLAAGSATLRRC